MKDKFIKIFSPFSLALGLLLANLFGCSDDSQAKRLQNIDESIKLSRNQLFQDNVSGAIEILQEAYSKHGESLSLCEALAYAYSQAEQYSSSAIYFEKAFKLSQNNLILLLNAGRAYEQCNAIDSALLSYERYLKINPKDANIHKEVAILQEKQRLYQKALNSYMDFLKNAGRAPNITEACEIAKLFLKLKNISQSKAWFNSALTACDASNIDLKSEILSGLIDIALAESDMANLENYQVELKKINAKYLNQKYPKLESEILAYKIKLQEAKIALEDAQKREAQEKAQEAKRLEEERIAKQAQEKAEAEKLAKEAQEAEEKAKQAEEDAKAEAEKLAKLEEEKVKAEEKAKAEEAKKFAMQAEAKAKAEKLAQEAEAKAKAEKLAQESAQSEGLLAPKEIEEEVAKTEEVAKQAGEKLEEKAESELQAETEAEILVAKAPKIQEAKPEAQVLQSQAIQSQSQSIQAQSQSSQGQRQAPQRQVEDSQEGLVEAPVASLDSLIFNCIKLIEAEEFSKAENLAQNIVADNPNSSRAWGVLAKAYFAQDMYRDAFLAAKQAFAKDRSDLRANLLRTKMAVYVEGEKTLLANLIALNKAFPECPPVLLSLARTYEYFGKAQDAQASYEKFFESTSEKDPLYADAQAEFSSEEAKKLDIKSIAKDLEL